MLGRTRTIHFVGIGGIGMSGIAELLANLGYAVSGSDARRSPITARLETLGVRVHEGHDASHVGSADVVVVSSAVKPLNPEVIEARRRHVPVIPRAEMLAELMRLRSGIAVAGSSHGKTSTTSMVALLLERAGFDPTAVIGGRLSAFGSNARLGRGSWMVAEADESDGSFLKLTPVIGIITNVDREHLDHYGTFDAVGDAFVTFANGVPFYGAVVACADDVPLRALFPRFTRRVLTYGIASEEAELRAVDVRLEPFASTCTVQQRTRDGATHTLGELRLAVPGRHNVLNALAAVGVGLELEIPFETIGSALAEFRGAERRFQVVGVAGGVTVIDDYGHHPSEIAAVVDAARACRPARLVLVFQPHRYTRTQHLMAEFARVLAHADVVVLTDIYAAGEDPIPGVSVEALAESLLAETRNPVHIVRPLDAIASEVAALAQPGDFVVTLGAGSIGTVGERIVAALQAGNEVRA